MACGKLQNIFKNSLRGRDEFIKQIFFQSASVELRTGSRMCQNRFWFGAENEIAVEKGIVKRFFSEAVAGQKKFPPLFIPDGDGEHSFEFFHEILLFFFNINARLLPYRFLSRSGGVFRGLFSLPAGFQSLIL